MQLTKEDINKYKEIYRQEFGEDISDQEAFEQATNLINMMRVVYRPIKKSWFMNDGVK
jgi:hypothetical protein